MGLIAFDGVSCGLARTPERGSNVARLYALYESPNKRFFPGGWPRVAVFAGRLRERLRRGGHSIVDSAHNAVGQYRADGDRMLDIAGFGCGGALAVELTHVIAADPNLRDVQIRFVALWDVLHANRDRCPYADEHHHRSLHARTFKAAHVMAIDESRRDYELQRQPRAYEMWFRGNHDDIGGCEGSRALADLTLAWMLRKSRLLRLPIRPGAIGGLKPDAQADISVPADATEFTRREVMENDRVHESVGFRIGPQFNNPDPDLIRIRR